MKCNMNIQHKNNLSQHNEQQASHMIITSIQHQTKISQTETIRIPAQLVVKMILQLILHSAKQKLHQNKTVNNHLSSYSYKFTQACVTECIDIHFERKTNARQFDEEQFPINIQIDNLIPGALELQDQPNNQNDAKQNSSETVSLFQRRNMLKISRISRKVSVTKDQGPQNKKNQKQSQIIKLNPNDQPNTGEVSFDPLIEQLRKMKSVQLNQNKREKQQKKKNHGQIIKNNEKVSFQFNGELIKVKQSLKKQNLLPNTLTAAHNEESIVKPKKVDKNPVALQPKNSKKDQTKKLAARRQSDFQFSNVMSLVPHLQIKQGVKFIHNKATVERKKNQPSIKEIKRSISQNTVSRSDFIRLKSMTGDNLTSRPLWTKTEAPSLPTIIKSQNDANEKNSSILPLSMSEAKFQMNSSPNSIKNSRKLATQKSHQKISVENQELASVLMDNKLGIVYIKDKLTTKQSEVNTSIKQQNEETDLLPLSPRDRANLLYMKTGSVGKLELPRISNRTVAQYQTNSKKIPQSLSLLLQSKAKAKGKRRQNEVERLRRQFQDKLRI